MQQTVRSAAQLGKVLSALSERAPWPGFSIGLDEAEYQHALDELNRASLANPWFTAVAINKSLGQWAKIMTEDEITQWLKQEGAQPMSHRRWKYPHGRVARYLGSSAFGNSRDG
jgi:hypothetical protein